MNTLYISDLDGTLLGKDATLGSETITGLNRLISNGINFTVATARTSATVVQMLSETDISLPVILMNGVCIYDIKKQEYIVTEKISNKGKRVLLDVIRQYIGTGFVYTIDNNRLSTYFENADSPAAKSFIEERERIYGKKFTKVDSFEACYDKSIVYYSIDDKQEKLTEACEELKKCDDLHVEFYRDIYNTDHWYLEVCSASASKKNAVITLRKLLGADRVISFGDNLNDIPMFEASDEAYAVGNAKEEVKKAATGVIGSNTDNGVVRFIAESI